MKRADSIFHAEVFLRVAFTPKGGCPLKRAVDVEHSVSACGSSIHPQGWVPIETKHPKGLLTWYVAFTPKGGCPLKPLGR